MAALITAKCNAAAATVSNGSINKPTMENGGGPIGFTNFPSTGVKAS